MAAHSRQRSPHGGFVMKSCLVVLILSLLVGCHYDPPERAPYCGPSCQEQRELEDEAWIEYQEWLAEQ